MERRPPPSVAMKCAPLERRNDSLPSMEPGQNKGPPGPITTSRPKSSHFMSVFLALEVMPGGSLAFRKLFRARSTSSDANRLLIQHGGGHDERLNKRLLIALTYVLLVSCADYKTQPGGESVHPSK